MSIPFAHHEAEVLTAAYDLIYVNTSEEGYRRIRSGRGFSYEDEKGNPVNSKVILERINALVIPPAWEKVWICKEPNGHIQATGIDSKGRKQYKYHPKWQRIRNETKFDRLYYFGKKLKKFRQQLKKDLRRRKLDKTKVTALAVSVMQETFIRIGNKSYEQEYGSHGLTTLNNRHVTFEQGKVFFKFKGKKGVLRKTYLKNKALENALKKVKEIPGQKLFQFYDQDNKLHTLDSGDINDYLKEHLDDAFTGKDFRTWFGCITAIRNMIDMRQSGKELTTKKSLVEVIDQVAEKLGNTRAVCRKYYIHPELLALYEAGAIDQHFKFKRLDPDDHLSVEKAFLRFLKERITQR